MKSRGENKVFHPTEPKLGGYSENIALKHLQQGYHLFITKNQEPTFQLMNLYIVNV